MRRLARIITFVADGQHIVARTDGKQNLRGARQQRNDSHIVLSESERIEHEGTEETEQREGILNRRKQRKQRLLYRSSFILLCYLCSLLFNLLRSSVPSC